MSIFQDELSNEFLRIKKLLEKGETLRTEDLKIILLARLIEEESHECK